MVAGRAFSWISGRPDVYPLFAVLAAGVGLTAYISVRHFYTDPELAISKKNRLAGPVDDNGIVLERAKGYSSSIFREMGEGKKKTIF